MVTNNGDGAVGSAVRGLSDPINMLDEMGGVVDTVGLTPGRENIWSSDRRFADILGNNIDQNRSILAYDDQEHPYARFGGQLASGIALPGASVEGVGLATARQAMRAGGSRFAAEGAAKAAVRQRLASAGAIEGGLAGFGQAEGGIVDRLPSAALGAGVGGALGYGSGALAQEVGPLARQTLDRIRGRTVAEAAVEQVPGQGVDQAFKVTPQPGARSADMASEGLEAMPSISSPRTVDRIVVNNKARPMLDPASDMERMRQAERVQPSDILPLPSNVVASQDEAASISAGLYPTVKAPNEAATLESRALLRGDDPLRTLPKRGPADLITFLRTRGGLIDHKGELRSLDLRNEGRDLDFARGERRFGKLLDDENGMTLDQAADLAWRSGYFPDHDSRPTIAEFLDALDGTNRGVNRAFRVDDMAEVDAFNAARDQRLAVERSLEQGAPLAEDRGQPVTLDDLEANQPPISAYEEWGDQAPDFAGNIRLSKLDSPQSIKRALVQAELMTGGFDAARRGRITQAETQSLADELGMTPESLLSRRKGQAFNAEEALAARQILAKSGNELVNMARRIQREERPGDADLTAFREALVRHAAVQEQIAGATAEAGRALSQFRMMADGRNVSGKVLASLVEGAGGADRIKDAADTIIDSVNDPGLLNRQSKMLAKPKFRDKAVELYYNWMLSGPQTHVVNMVSNTMTSLAQIPEHAAAAAIGAARDIGRTATKRGALTGEGDRVLFTELGARSFGLLQGVKEGISQARRTFMTGETSDLVTKVEGQTENAIGGKLGKILNTPTRALAAEDELFKAMARRMELGGLAVRRARAEGLRGDDAKKRIADLMANPPDDLLEKAFDYGRYVTFQRPLSTGHGLSQSVQMAANKAPILKIVVPFVRTPTNLLKFAIERSPAAPILREWRKDFVAGGARRDLAVARAMVGTGFGVLMAELAAQGHISAAGPADDNARRLLRADGWQPYSVKIGEEYVSYQRLDPFSTTLGVAAGMVELQDHMTAKQKDEVSTLLVTSMLQNLSSKTWLSGISDVLSAVNEPDRYSQGWLKRLAGSVVPAGVAQVARTTDPTLREAETILDAVRNRIPVMSRSLQPRRDMWGEAIKSEGGIGPDILSPAWLSTRRNDPVNNALLTAGIRIGQPRREVGGERLNALDWGQYRETIGQVGRNALSGLVASPEWESMPQDDKQDEVDRIMKAARKEAKAVVMGNKIGANRDVQGDPWAAFQDAK